MFQLTTARDTRGFQHDLTGTKGGGWPNYQWSNSEKYDWIYPNIQLIIDNKQYNRNWIKSWWPFSALLAPCEGNSPVTGELPALRPVTPNFDVFFDLCLTKWLSKQPFWDTIVPIVTSL